MRFRAAVAAAVVAVLLASCGDDSGGGDASGGAATPPDPARTAAFCDEVRSLQAGDAGLDISDPAGLAAFEQLIAGAPSAVQDDLNYFVDQTKRFEDLDEDDPTSIGEAFGLFFDPEFIDAIKGFGTFLRDECDIDVPGLDELEDFDPDALQQDLSDLDGELDDLQDQLDDLGEGSVPTTAPG